MFLQDIPLPIALRASSTNYKTFYQYRTNQLLEYMMRLFTWRGLPDSIPAHEIDIYLYLYGRCGINKARLNDDLLAVVPEWTGCTNYLDIPKTYTWCTPIQSGQCYIGKTGVLIDNTLLHNSSYPLIHTTASRLAHIDSTIICALVNGRDNVAIKASTQKFAADAEAYQRQKYNGIPSFIVDRGFSTIEIDDLKTQNTMNIRELLDSQQLILSEFYETIGINKTVEKRERLITAEAAANEQLLKLNINNMYMCRVKGAEEINKMFGTSITVECNVEIANESVKDPEETPDERGGSEDGTNENKGSL